MVNMNNRGGYKMRTILVTVFMSALILGYALGMHHEAKIQEGYQAQAEKYLAALEEEFYSALDKPHTFHIFNGQFEIYPVKSPERRFHYRRVKDDY